MENQLHKRIGLGVALTWLFICLFPLWWVLVTAFKPPLAVSQGATYIPFLDFKPTLQAFRDAFSGIRGDFMSPIFSSLAVSTVSTALSVLLGSMAAYALVRFEFRIKLLAGIVFAIIAIGGFIFTKEALGWSVPAALGSMMIIALVTSVWLNGKKLPGPIMKNDDVTFWFVSQRMFPPIVSAFALFLLYAEMNKSGVRMLDSFAGLVLAYTAFGLPFAVWLMRDFFSTIPVEVEEAAMVDNIGRMRIFFQIVLPMSKPGLVATSMIVLSFIWNEFLFALLLTSSKWQTLPILLAGQNSSRGDEWWAISVAALISVIPMIIVAIFLGRMMRSGLLAGSIK
ncbi:MULTISPECIES: carbohydrate ABC transporter permease [Pacificibacter]|uniref:carbohydrate ABC transporter permease n=1 Tax=Pacificibacter TaxID=1042323 RepID=UPI001C0869A6|nr:MULTISPECIES: carbohydrate ABC transporter permease [Pacificibacter]MBU2937161.1 carbohydrate ABC transporter permease [Pacificibacter marinus]MDO6617019.1 carbohydrate ABC transporter permease [Pacificibacter sp. 1_MG-2023]